MAALTFDATPALAAGEMLTSATPVTATLLRGQTGAELPTLTSTWPDPNAGGLTALVFELVQIDPNAEWVQPTNQYTAYHLLDPFTGTADRCMFGGKQWIVTSGDANGDNVWQPGVQGWTQVQS